MESISEEYVIVNEFVPVLNIRCRLVKPVTTPGSIMLSEVEVSRSQGPRGQGVGLRPLVFWDCGFESHRVHCLSL
jgi:hypothetical protein